jgi:hypothetical protein
MRSDLGVCMSAVDTCTSCLVPFFWEGKGVGREEGVRTSVWECGWS